MVDEIGLPFAFGWPQPPIVRDMGESASAIYRRVLTGEDIPSSKLDLQIALHPCRDLAGCLADRAAFDKQWTAAFKAPAPTTAKGKDTWLTVQSSAPYTLTMSHAFSSGGRGGWSERP